MGISLPTTMNPKANQKPMSKKLIAIQLTVVFLLGFFFMCTVKINYKDNCSSSSLNLCQSNYFDNNDDNNDMNNIDDLNDITIQTPPSVFEAMDQLPIQPKRTEFPYTIVTASSANHLCSLENYLYSLHALKNEIPIEEFPRIVVYNIGMNRTQLPVLDQLQAHGLIDEVEIFDYFKYPRFWDVAINAGEYAWKTGIVNEARLKYGGILVWLDAGNMVTADFIRQIPNTILEHDGFWSPRSSYNMGKFTHQGMYDYYGLDGALYAKNINCNGAAVGFDTTNQTIVKDIIVPWYECGLNKNCIAPPGSSRENHRQDQAALTLLAYKSGYKCLGNPSKFHGLQIHRDVACRVNLMELDLQGQLHHPSAIDFPKWYKSDTLELFNHPEWRYPENKVPPHIQSLIQPPDGVLL
ncbi:unnamed protein product [Cunninghamella echinulata]